MTSSHPQPGPNAPRAAAADTTLEPFLPSDTKELEIDHTDDLVFLRPYVSDQTYEFIRHNSGLVLVGASQFFFACMAATVKYFLSISDISVPTLIAVRMGITAVFSAVILLIQRDPYPFLGPPEHRKLLFVRGAVGFLGLSSNYLSLKGLSVSDSAAIGFLIPAATAVLGVLVLKEKMTRREVIAGGLCLCGVMLVARPPALFGSWAAGPDPGLEKPKSSRAVAVFWAFMSVVGASFACESLVSFCGAATKHLLTVLQISQSGDLGTRCMLYIRCFGSRTCVLLYLACESSLTHLTALNGRQGDRIHTRSNRLGG